MAAVGVKKSSQVVLLHDHMYTLPGSTDVISLKAGEKFILVGKVSDNWWSVVRTETDKMRLYVPTCYVEEIPFGRKPDATNASSNINGNSVRKEPPPKPPIKPKNILGKLELPNSSHKQTTSVTDEARIELFNILISQNNGLLSVENDRKYNKETELDKVVKTGVVDSTFGDYLTDDDSGTSAGKLSFKGSMQSLDMEFLEDHESGPISSDESIVDKTGQYYVNVDLQHSPTSQLVHPPSPSHDAVPLKKFDSNYEMHLDRLSGRTYYFNRVTRERSWTLPRKVSQMTKETQDESNDPDVVPLIWKETFNEKGEKIFVNQLNDDKFVHLYEPSKGREYFFNDETGKSLWELPQFYTKHGRSDKSIQDKDKDIADQFSDKVGVLYKAKLSQNGKKIKKSWSHSHVVLCGSMLYFHKEPKSSNSKMSLSKPEGFVDLRSATVQMGTNDRSSRKNLIQLMSANGTEYLLHHEDMEVIEEWYEALAKNISLVTKLLGTLTKTESTHSLNNELDRSPTALDSPAIKKKEKEKQKQSKKLAVAAAENVQENFQSSADKTRLKEKLRFWLNRRPSKDSLRAKGIYKEGIFGSHLLTICEKENTTIPKFVQDCIDAVESRGLTVDGIYRLSGNMADIQKLRFIVNQSEPCDLQDPELDIHVVAGAMKLFFRELLEPLFPFRFFHRFLDAYKIPDPTAKSKAIKDLVNLIPAINYDTMKEVFRHLVLVVQHSQENRMQSQNIAIVFGPTLMWPDETTDSNELAVSLVQRGQLIEYMIQDYAYIFS